METELESDDDGVERTRSEASELPVTATVAPGSLLGGDAQVSLVSSCRALAADAALPRSASCDASKQLCDGGTIRGVQAPSITSVTQTMQKLLTQAQKAGLVPALAQSTKPEHHRELLDQLGRSLPTMAP